jgi:UDP-glucose 4-epimerase
MFESIVGHSIPYQIFPRRSGDLAEYFCDTSKAKEVLVWQAEKNLRDMCEDALRWNKVVKVAKNKFK